ncbi:MAG: hypothetical protein ACOVN3_06135 [Limnohabitans sp.]
MNVSPEFLGWTWGVFRQAAQAGGITYTMQDSLNDACDAAGLEHHLALLSGR